MPCGGGRSSPVLRGARHAPLNEPAGRTIGEFELIRRFFVAPSAFRPETVLGIGDDCALLRLAPEQDLAITADTLVSGVHFFPDVDPADLGHKVLAVNLSDLAAAGATPGWVTLCLTLPQADASWLQRFHTGFFGLAGRYRVDLIGGDTTRGPLSITVQAMGCVPAGKALRRSGARPGDLIYLTGTVGSAGLGLKRLQGEFASSDSESLRRLLRPEPRVSVGLALLGLAHACIDVSDGLAADLGHVLVASGVGATIDWDLLPLSPEVRRYVAETGDWRMPLTAGDDYELCFTVPSAQQASVENLSSAWDCSCRRVGIITAGSGLTLMRAGRMEQLPLRGFDHFRTDRAHGTG